MESRELIEPFRQELGRVKAQGSKQVAVTALLEYISALEKSATVSSDHRRQQYEGKLAEYAANNELRIEMLRAVLESGKSALQALLIINGGAVVALMGVMANLAGKPEGMTLARYLALPLLEFGFGVLCGAIGFALATSVRLATRKIKRSTRSMETGSGLRQSSRASPALCFSV